MTVEGTFPVNPVFATAHLSPITDPDEITSLPPKECGELIAAALQESKAWLAVATKGADPTPVAEFKAWAVTVAEMTRQKGLARDIQMDAQEMVRRAERGIGLTIRNGQNAGEFVREHQAGGVGRHQQLPGQKPLRSPTEFLTKGNTMTETYDLTDGVTDEQFDDAVAAARQDRNLSRANVIREIQTKRGETTDPDRDALASRRREAYRGETRITNRHKDRHLYIRADQVRTVLAQREALLATLTEATNGLDPAITDIEAANFLRSLDRSGGGDRRLRRLLTDRKDTTS